MIKIAAFKPFLLHYNLSVKIFLKTITPEIVFFSQLCRTINYNMVNLRFYFIITCCIFSTLFLKDAAFAQPVANIKQLKFLGQHEIPYEFQFNKTTVGGLSGIDYDAVNKCFYIISDDRSEQNAARFYTAKIVITPHGIDSIYFMNVTTFLQSNGDVYPNNKQDPYNTPDPEAMRYNPITKQLIWSSEGERIVRLKDTVLEDPSIISISKKGNYLNKFTLPQNLKMQSTESGPRQNGVLEGLSFAANYTTLFANVEEPLYQDGDRADTTNNKTFIRILQFNTATRKNTKQFAYQLEPVAFAPNPANAFKVNGVPDILSIGHNKLLVIERSYSTGRVACTIKLFIADLNKATDIKPIFSLKTNTKFVSAPKNLLLNMDALGIYTDNIEGVTFGPLLPNGHKTLLFIADNNFSNLQKTQLLLFEVIEQ